MTKTNRSAGGRLAVITVDQVISGASNVLTAVLAARLLSAAGFGLFGIVFLLYMILVGVTRALVSDPLLVHPAESRERPGEAIGTAAALAVPLTLCLLAAGFSVRLWSATLGDGLLALAASLPLLIIQDVGRYLGFATQRPMRAVALDTIWVVVMLPAVAALFATGTHALPWLVAAWGGSGALAGLLLFRWYRVGEVRFGISWLRHTWGLSWRYLVSYTSMQSAALGMSSEVGGIAGARALGGVQGTLLMVRPFTTFAVAVVAAATGEVARCAGETRRIWRHAVLSSGVSTAVAGANMLVMILLPSRLGELVLGASWHPAQPLLVPAGVQIVFAGLFIGPQAALLGVRAMREAMAINVATTVIVLIAAACGAVLDGALGALWLVTAAQGIVTVAWWVTFATRIGEASRTAVAQAPHERPLGLRALLAQAAEDHRRAAATPIPTAGVASPWLI